MGREGRTGRGREGGGRRKEKGWVLYKLQLVAWASLPHVGEGCALQYTARQKRDAASPVVCDSTTHREVMTVSGALFVVERKDEQISEQKQRTTESLAGF